MDLLEEKIFEIISVYFSNNYFCSLYTEACNYYNDDKFATIEQAYTFTIDSFNQAMKQTKVEHGRNNNFYPSIMNSVKNMYNEYMNKNLTYNRFMDIMAKVLIPYEMHEEINADMDMKFKVIRAIMIKVVSKFTVYVLNEAMDDVLSLENRQNNDISILQNLNKKWKGVFKDTLISEKNHYRSITIAKRNGVDLSPNEVNNGISEEIVEHLETKVNELIHERNIIIKERNKLTKYVKILIKQLRETQYTLDEYEAEIEELKKKKPAPKVVSQTKVISQTKPVQNIQHNEIRHEPLNIDHLPAVMDFKNLEYHEVDMIPMSQQPVLESIEDPEEQSDIDDESSSISMGSEPEFSMDD